MFPIVKLKLTLRAVTDLVFTEYKGSTLRGLFKKSLREACCSNPRAKCTGCLRFGACAYSVLNKNRTPSGEDTALPYTLDCSRLQRSFFRRGDRVVVDLRIFGRAANWLPTMAAGMAAWGSYDIGRFQCLFAASEVRRFGPPDRWPSSHLPRGRLALEAIEPLPMAGGSENDTGPEADLNGLLCPEKNGLGGIWEAGLDFLSPVEMRRKIDKIPGGKKSKQAIGPDRIDPDLLFRSVLARYCNLSEHFGSGQVDTGDASIQQAQQDAKKAVILDNRLTMETVRRFPGKNSQYHSGFMGFLKLGNLSGRLVRWLQAGEMLQIGKSTTMGFGAFQGAYRRVS